MPTDIPDHSRPELSAAAHREWDGHVEAVLRGIAHALNNRAAALSAVLELARDPAEDSAVSAILGTELERVGDLVSAVRSMVAGKGGPEAFDPADVALEAQAILQLHAELRHRHVTIVATDAEPLRVPRWMFVRVLVVLGANAARACQDPKVVIAADGDWLIALAAVDDARATSTGITPCLTELAHALGGEPLRTKTGFGFRVPTLAALRRREGRED